EVPPNRWLLWTGGPGWGPVVLFWQHLLVLALAAWALGRWAPAPLAWYPGPIPPPYDDDDWRDNPAQV
ncbi:MAG TPA: hypothetical protein VGA17_12570, partial [Nitrospiraceae bacterium]